MNGRRGVDELTTALGFASMVLALIGSIFSISWLGWIALIIVVLALVRAFSTNIGARENENDAFLGAVSKVPFLSGLASPKGTAQTMWENRKTTMYFKCKNCGQILSVPRGKGRLRVTCPKCGTQMEKKS